MYNILPFLSFILLYMKNDTNNCHLYIGTTSTSNHQHHRSNANPLIITIQIKVYLFKFSSAISMPVSMCILLLICFVFSFFSSANFKQNWKYCQSIKHSKMLCNVYVICICILWNEHEFLIWKIQIWNFMKNVNGFLLHFWGEFVFIELVRAKKRKYLIYLYVLFPPLFLCKPNF